jgi:fructosamine-3-kinase
VGEPAASAHVRSRLGVAFGPVVVLHSLGDAVWMLEVDGRRLVAKSGPGALDEAAGLRRLAGVPGAPPVPEVVLVDTDLLVTTAVEQMPRSERHDDALGRSLALLHRASYPQQWGGGSSWIGACPVESTSWADGDAFYAHRLLELAARCQLEAFVGPVAERLASLVPAEGPATVHGDLWWGNVLSGSDGRSWLIDPSVHGGYPEEDLAMLALFGAVPDRLLGAYSEIRPLETGWEARVGLFQLVPLLVHAVLFGGRYRSQAKAVARRYA